VETVDWGFPVTAEEVVMMGRYQQQKIWPWPSLRDRKAARELLSRVGRTCCPSAHRRAIGWATTASSARALVGEPEIVLLDEPTSSSDLHVQHRLHPMADLNQQGLTILLSTHDLNSVATRLPWVICFNHGLIREPNH